MNEEERNRITENGRWPLLKTRPDNLPEAAGQDTEYSGRTLRQGKGSGRAGNGQAGRNDGSGSRRSTGTVRRQKTESAGHRSAGTAGRDAYSEGSRPSGRRNSEGSGSQAGGNTGRQRVRRNQPAQNRNSRRRNEDSASGYMRSFPDRFRRFLKNPTADIPFLVGCVIAVVLVILVICLIVRAATGRNSAAGQNQTSANSVSTTSAAATPTPAPAYTPTDVKLSFVGDVLLGMDENMSYSSSLDAFYDLNGADYFFSNVKAVFDADDVTVANLQGTFTNETTRSDKTYAFKADPEYVNILADASIDAVDLANDHSDDYGAASYTDTVSQLESSGISHFGNDDVALVDVRGIQVGFYGIDQVDDPSGASNAMTATVQKLKDQDANIIIGYFYWGNEQDTYPTQEMVDLAHGAVDAGTDLVVGCGTRALEGIEYYQDKTIAYGLGSFCYGGSTNPADVNTIILQPTFTMDNQGTITNSTLNIIPCQISSDANYNDYQPQILTGSDAQAVLDELDERSTEIANNYTDITTVYNSNTDGTIGVNGSGINSSGNGSTSSTSSSESSGTTDGTDTGSTSGDGTAADGTVSDGTAGDGTAADGTVTDGTAADGTTTDGTYDTIY